MPMRNEYAVDHGLAYERYYMLNAAVAMEAYDSTEQAADMVDPAWAADGVPAAYRASRWSGLFGPEDFRSKLTWRGRFAGITNAVNCYSETEDVVGNPRQAFTVLGETSWVMQEYLKGDSRLHAINLIPGSHISCEGGWGRNAHYPLWLTAGSLLWLSGLTREDVIEHPLRVLLLIGKTYDVEGSQPFDVVAKSDERIEVTGIGANQCEIVWPVEFAVAEGRAPGSRPLLGATWNNGGKSFYVMHAEVATLTSVRVELTPAHIAISNPSPHRHVFGVDEFVRTAFYPSDVSGAWIDEVDVDVNADDVSFWCPWNAGLFHPTVSVAGASYQTEVEIIEPIVSLSRVRVR